MNNNNFDEKLYSYFQNKNTMPSNIEENIINFNLKYSKKKKNTNMIKKLRKIFEIIIAGLALSSTVCIGGYFIYHSNITDEGVKNAIENGYIYEPTQIDESEDEKIKTGISSILLDDYNMNMDLKLKIKNNINIEGYEHFYVKDVIIYDDKNIIYYYDSEYILNEFFNEKNLTFETSQGSSGITGISIYDVSNNEGIINFNIKKQVGKFPKSKKLFIKFKTISFEGNIDKSKKDFSINGNYSSSIKIPDRFQDRKSINYNFYSNDSRINTNNAQINTTESGTMTKFEMYWGDYEYWTKKTNQIRNDSVIDSEYIKFEKCYIENSKGEKYFCVQTGSNCNLMQDGNLKIELNFSLLKNNCTNIMKIVIFDINNNPIEISLRK